MEWIAIKPQAKLEFNRDTKRWRWNQFPLVEFESYDEAHKWADENGAQPIIAWERDFNPPIPGIENLPK